MDSTSTPGFELNVDLLLAEINLKYNYDFRNYSSASMNRRIAQAMNRMGYPTLSALRESVIKDSGCFHDLLQFLTVPVSEMFRDPTYYLALRQKVLPVLRTYPSLKIWVAGCSTGEEVYSLAILLKEEELLERTIIYATDINSRSLEQAEKGIFNIREVEKFSRNYQRAGGKHSLSDYYSSNLKSVKFDRSLCKHITFANHSLVSDAVFAETHLISCRNVLIYFNRELQDRVFGLFHESLCRRGFLGLGNKETLQFSKHAKYFDTFIKEDRLYQKNGKL